MSDETMIPEEEIVESETVAETDEKENVSSPSVTEKRPYHERYYLRYCNGKRTSALDLEGTKSFLQAIGFDGGELRQAREGKNRAEDLSHLVSDKNNQMYCSYCGVEIAGAFHDLSLVIGDDIDAYEGKEIVVGFRPEGISLSDVEDSFKFTAEVELTELLGDNTNVYVDMLGDKVILKVDPHDTPEMDTKISFCVPHKNVYLFDAETEEVLNKYEN